MSKLMSGAEVIDWLKVSPIELFNDLVKKGLQPHDGAGRPLSPADIFKNIISTWQKELAHHEDVASQLTEIEREEIRATRIHPLGKQIYEAQKVLNTINSNKWVDLKLPELKKLENMAIHCLISAYYLEHQVKSVDAEITATPAETPNENIQPSKDSIKKNHKELPRDRHRRQTRAVAKKIWDKHPTKTVPDVIEHPDILEAAKKSNGQFYADKTIKAWIKDLNPNEPLKGRPRKNPRN
jgi:hypothetical protein